MLHIGVHGAAPIIPDYALLRPIGRGAYGEVWLARSVTGIYRAAKIVYRARFEEARPFEREFAGIQRFEPLSRGQENQLTILHVGRNEAGGYFYYVMELADDAAAVASLPDFNPPFDAAGYKPRTLKELLTQRGRLSAAECARIAIGLCNALEHLHSHGLIHRDIKPSNIIFVGGRPKLADIGLVSSIDATRSFVGTEGYVPREGPGSPRADLFSLGKVMYEAATGRRCSEFPLLPPDLDTMTDRSALLELNEVIVKACAEDALQRYKSAADIRAELHLLQAGKSVRRLHRVERQLKRLVPVGCALAVLAFAVILIQQIQADQVRERARVESRFRKRAEASELATRQLLYAADMNLVQQAYTAGDFGRARTLLQSHMSRAGEPDLRGFEWHYFWRATEGQQRLILSGHSNAVRRAAFSPDGKWVASASYDGTVKLWDSSRHTAMASFPCEGAARDVAFSHDGARLFFHDEMGRLECREVTTGRQLYELKGGFTGMAVNPADHLIALCFGRSGGTAAVQNESLAPISIRDSRDGRELYSLSDIGPVLAFAPNGDRLAAGGPDKHLHVWDIHQRRIIAALHSVQFRFDVAFSPDGRSLALGDGAGTLRVWDLAAPQSPRECQAHRGCIWQVAYAPDGRTLATVGTDQALRLWDARTLAPLSVLRGHTGEVWGLGFSHDGAQIVTASKDGTVRVWDLCEHAGEADLSRNVQFWNWPIFSDDGQLVSAGENGVAKIWRTADGGQVASVRGVVRPLAFAGHEQSLWALDATGGVQLLTRSGREVSAPLSVTNIHAATVRAHAMIPERLLVLGHRDGTIRIWDLATRTERRVWKAHPGGITAIVVSGNLLVSTSAEEANAKIWNLHDGALLQVLAGHKLPIFSAAFSPDGKQLATASPDDTCRLWDLGTGKSVAVLDGHKAGAYSVAYAPDGKTLAVGTGDAQVKLWNLNVLRDMGGIEAGRVTVFAVRFDSLGQTLATTTFDSESGKCSLRLLSAASPAAH